MEPTTMLALGTLGASIVGNIWNAYQGKKTSDRNYNIQKEQLEYQKYLNNNQIQMQVADAEKAGINPLALNGTQSLQSGSYSNVQPTQIDTSALSGIAQTILQNENSQKIAEKQAESAENVARINALSAERQTQMKIDADTETQQNQQLWQSLENSAQRIFEANENKLGRENAKKIANKSAQTMKDIAKMNTDLQKWINTYQTPGTEKDGEAMNILSAQLNTTKNQLQQLAGQASLDESYRRQLFELQNELQDLQKNAIKAGIAQGYINSISNAIGSVGNLIQSIGNFGKPGPQIYNTGDTYKTTNIDNLYGR